VTHIRTICRWRIPSLLAALVAGGLVVAGCAKKQPHREAKKHKGVVGKVVTIQGEVTYTESSSKARKPLKVGMELRAEWTVQTGRDAKLSARLINGHLWTLSGELSKKVSTIAALTLPPTKEGAYDKLTALGTRDGMDRSASAGLHQEHTAATKAAPSRVPTPSDSEMAALDEIRPVPKAEPKPSPATTPPPATTPKPAMRTRSGSSSRTSAGERGGRGQRGRAGRGAAPRRRTSAIRGLLRAGASKPSPQKPPPPPPPTGAQSLPSRLTRAQIKSVVKRLLPMLRACMRKLKVTGLQRVRLTLKGSTGRVSTLSVQGRAAGDALTKCMLRRARSVRFPKFTTAKQSFTLPVKSQ